MSYGKYCPVCGGTVDRNEYDFLKDMCDECVVEKELQDRRSIEVTKMMKADYRQLVLNI